MDPEDMDIEEDMGDFPDIDIIENIGPDFAAFDTLDSEDLSSTDFELLSLFKNAIECLKYNKFLIASGNKKAIVDASDPIEEVLLVLPCTQMKSNVKDIYLKLLDTLFDVRFPVTRIVNHVVVIGLRYTRNISEYYSGIMTPADNDKLNYFLRHAHDPKYGLSIKGFRFSDFLVADFFRQDCPRALLDILRYGCSDLLKHKCFNLKPRNWRQVGSTSISEYKLLDTLQFFLSILSYMGSVPNKEIQAKADCLKIIFRSLHTFSFEQLYALSDFADYSNGLEGFKSFGLKFLNKTKRFPELDERMGKEPSNLKHLCRFEIRKTLYKNWALPDGIKTLGLPFALEEYLDLKTD